jgi:opacity protein-like surface antigen
MRRDAHRFAARAAACAVVALASVPAASAEGWKVRGAVVWVEPDLDFADEDLLTRLSLTADGALGLGVGAEYRLTERLGLEFGLVYAEPEVELAVGVGF